MERRELALDASSLYVEDVRRCGEYDVAVLGVPFDGGTTYRSETRFGPQGIRKISALYGSYSFELGVDLRESITIADLGDVFTIPGNIEKTFDQISKAVGHVYACGAFPVVLGGDHSILVGGRRRGPGWLSVGRAAPRS